MAAKKRTRPTTAPPVSDTRQRVSATFHDEAVTTRERMAVRPSMAPALAAIDRLLTLTHELPVGEGEEAVLRAVVDAVADLFVGVAVGVCFVRHGREPLVIRKQQGGDKPGADPARLFPHLAYETIVDVPCEPAGSTLHVASDDPLLGADVSTTGLLRRAARVLTSGIEYARAKQGIRGAKSEVETLTSQMVQAEKLASLGQIAAGMVHELNNPLTSIVAYSDYLNKRWSVRVDVDREELERLRRIGESAHRLLRFTRDLVSYARPASEVPVPVVLGHVIDQALAFCEHEITAAGASIERHVVDGVHVRGMPEQLTQVFVNLVTNACHAVARGGAISIATELVDDGGVRVVVSDTGHGIAKENLERIFAPFFTTKTDGRGTGLGLPIVKSIVDGHGGRIDVESEVSRGTRFAILLPIIRR